MALEIEAVYDHGMLKLERELPLQAGQKVRIIIQAQGGAASRLSGLIKWTGVRQELVSYLNDPDEGVLGSHDI
jgi:predicted DNA-binding antitoxin AbrB/MazE fold protein